MTTTSTVSPTPTIEDYQALVRWFLFGNTGLSSIAIATYLMGGEMPDIETPWGSFKARQRTETPHDAGDFDRCYHLLKRVPYLREHFEQMRSLSCLWGDLVEAWPQLTEWYEANEARKIYDLLREMEQWHYCGFDYNTREHTRGKHITDEEWAQYQKQQEDLKRRDEEYHARLRAEQAERDQRRQERVEEAKKQHFTIGDIVRWLPEGTTWMSKAERKERLVVIAVRQSKSDEQQEVAYLAHIHGQGYPAYQRALQTDPANYTAFSRADGLMIETPAAEVKTPKRGKKTPKNERVTIIEDDEKNEEQAS